MYKNCDGMAEYVQHFEPPPFLAVQFMVLLLHRQAGLGDVVDEHVFARILGLKVAGGIQIQVVAASQNEQGLAIRTHAVVSALSGE